MSVSFVCQTFIHHAHHPTYRPHIYTRINPTGHQYSGMQTVAKAMSTLFFIMMNFDPSQFWSQMMVCPYTCPWLCRSSGQAVCNRANRLEREFSLECTTYFHLYAITRTHINTHQHTSRGCACFHTHTHVQTHTHTHTHADTQYT